MFQFITFIYVEAKIHRVRKLNAFTVPSLMCNYIFALFVMSWAVSITHNRKHTSIGPDTIQTNRTSVFFTSLAILNRMFGKIFGQKEFWGPKIFVSEFVCK